MIKRKIEPRLIYQQRYKRNRKYVLAHGVPKKFQKHGITQTRWRMKLKTLNMVTAPFGGYCYYKRGYIEDLATGCDCWVVGTLFRENVYMKDDEEEKL